MTAVADLPEVYTSEWAPPMRWTIRDGVSLFQAALAGSPEAVAVSYGNHVQTYAQVDIAARRIAGHLRTHGVGPGDRVMVWAQNTPVWLVSVLAVWTLGGVVVPVNPMYTSRELRHILRDSEARAVVAGETIWEGLDADLRKAPQLDLVLLDADRDDADTHGDFVRIASTSVPLDDLTSADPESAAFITYTSGTTGSPKGAVNTHANITFSGSVNACWMRLPEHARILAIAPLAHITGLISHLVAALVVAGELVLMGRFDPHTALATIRSRRPQFTVAAITAFISLLNEPSATAEDFASFEAIISGGAPVPAAVVDQFQKKYGQYLHNGYGMTESSAGTILVPRGQVAPIDPSFGCVALGQPVYGVEVDVVDDDERVLAVGEVGELVVRGPMVTPGYWHRPDETAWALRGGSLHTGDLGFRNDDGWVFLVDRKKDLIVTAGYKVWPREVEDVLYAFPGVQEAVVIGAPDDYRGEIVTARVVLREGFAMNAAAIRRHCRANLAAFKVPRVIEQVDQLAKTPTGKILRRSLDDGI